MLPFQRSCHDHALPQEFAASAVEAQQLTFTLLVVALDARGHKEAVAPDYRRRMADARNRDFPGNVLGLAPTNWNALFQRRPIAARTAPSGPVLGTSTRSQQE